MFMKLMEKLDRQQEQLHQQSLNYVTSLQTLRYDMKKDVQGIVAEALATLYRPGHQSSTLPAMPISSVVAMENAKEPTFQTSNPSIILFPINPVR
jgi:hypothetical protein